MRSIELIDLLAHNKWTYVEQRSRADFAPDFAPDIKLPLSKLTATDNIMLGNHVQ
jgi:hypothetical protein